MQSVGSINRDVGVAIALLLLLAGTTTASARDLLREGNVAYQGGEYAKAGEIFDSEDNQHDLLTRRFNSGVSWLQSGNTERAIERFEDVASRAAGDLRRSALHNVAWSHFQTGQKILQPDESDPAATAQQATDINARIAVLTKAAQSFQSSVEFFRQVERKDEDVRYNLGVAKTALRAVIDEITRLEEQKEQQEEDELLKDPPELIRRLIQTEKGHRNLCRQMKDAPKRERRLPCRQLRKAETKNRGLAEKLLHYLTTELEAPASGGQTPPSQPGGQPGQAAVPEKTEEEKARLQQAKTAVESAIAAMQKAEVDYGRLEVESAASSHTEAIRQLRTALLSFPVDIATVIAEAVTQQEQLLGFSEQLHQQQSGENFSLGEETNPEKKASGLGSALVGALKNRLLKPIAKLLTPKATAGIAALAEEEEEIVWAARIISQAEVPATMSTGGPQAAAGGPAGPHGGPGGPHGGAMGPHGGAHGGAAPNTPTLTEEQARELSEGLQAAGKDALAAAEFALQELTAGQLESALPHERQALEALRRAQDLLPKQLEQRLAELIERQRAAKTAQPGLKELPEDTRAEARTALVSSQDDDGGEAGEIAGELEPRKDDRAQRALPKVREGEQAIFSSAEALRRELDSDAEEATDRAIASLEEALAILTGQDQQQGQDEQDQQEQQQDQGQQQQDQQQPQPQGAYQLSAERAREEREKMDQDRRHEEAKILSGGPSITVEKDW